MMMFPLCFYSALPLKFFFASKNRPADRSVKQHSIGVVKQVFGFAKTRYRGLTKKTHRLLVTCALANLFIARRHLLRCRGA
jgi:transposase, IS5 family